MSNTGENVFALEEAENYNCIVWRYQIAHSTLLLRLDLPNKFRDKATTYYLAFSGVYYFEGPIRWQSAAFQLGNKDELGEIVDRVEKAASMSADEREAFITEYSHLYKVVTPDFEVKIIANRKARRFSYQDAPRHWHGTIWGYQPPTKEEK
jgi:hypothetical protein